MSPRQNAYRNMDKIVDVLTYDSDEENDDIGLGDSGDDTDSH